MMAKPSARNCAFALSFPHKRRGDLESLKRCQAAKRRYCELSRDDQHGNPYRSATHRDQSEEGAGDEQLVSGRVQKGPEHGR